MNKKKSKKRRIPAFASHQEEAEFWDTHDITDYLDSFTVVDRANVTVDDSLSTGITVRLTPEMLRRLRARAKQKGIGPSTLARMWIIEHLRDDEP